MVNLFNKSCIKMLHIENRNNKYKIVLCEIFNPYIHGIDDASDPEIAGHYLVDSTYDSLPFDSSFNGSDSDSDGDSYNGSNDSDDSIEYNNIYDVIPSFRGHIRMDILPYDSRAVHPFIRNYKKIISNKNYIKPEIAECFYLSGDECVAILKTFWIRIVQRAWKRVFAERTRIISLRKTINALKTREIYGKWPDVCCYLPGLYGMLILNQARRL